jgi:hypothetical protein
MAKVPTRPNYEAAVAVAAGVGVPSPVGVPVVSAPGVGVGADESGSMYTDLRCLAVNRAALD